MNARATSSARASVKPETSSSALRERLGRPGPLCARMSELAQTLDVFVEPRRAALAQHSTQERAEHAHIRPHPLGNLLAGLEPSDEVDRFGLGRR